MKPQILVTNDDGVLSPGIKAIMEAIEDLADMLVVAPINQQTAMGRAFPRYMNQGIIEKQEIRLKSGKCYKVYGVHGSPALAVAHGVCELSERKPDLCLSGINYGENLGLVVTCSGTIGAIIEAESHGIPGIAFSRELELKNHRSEEFEELDWEIHIKCVRYWVKKVLKEGMPYQSSYLNINIPNEPQISSSNYAFTRLAHEPYLKFKKPQPRDYNKPYYLQAELLVEKNKIATDSDIYVFHVERNISVTPMTWDMSLDIK